MSKNTKNAKRVEDGIIGIFSLTCLSFILVMLYRGSQENYAGSQVIPELPSVAFCDSKDYNEHDLSFANAEDQMTSISLLLTSVETQQARILGILDENDTRMATASVEGDSYE